MITNDDNKNEEQQNPRPSRTTTTTTATVTVAPIVVAEGPVFGHHCRHRHYRYRDTEWVSAKQKQSSCLRCSVTRRLVLLVIVVTQIHHYCCHYCRRRHPMLSFIVWLS